jgi:hypothetical protein
MLSKKKFNKLISDIRLELDDITKKITKIKEKLPKK